MSFRPVGSELQAILGEWLENPETRRLVLQRTWQRAVGDPVARRCRPLQFEDGVLTVEVTDSSWAPQLATMTGELISKINGALGKPWVRRIEWAHGEGLRDTSGAAPRS